MNAAAPDATPAVPAAIGARTDDGIYAGLTLHDNAAAELVLLPGEFKGTWQEALAWAEQLGGTLPSRIDLLVLHKNLPDEFQESWYWSGEQHADNGDYAWCQYFGHGDQDNYHKYSSLRARAVRRLVIR